VLIVHQPYILVDELRVGVELDPRMEMDVDDRKTGVRHDVLRDLEHGVGAELVEGQVATFAAVERLDRRVGGQRSAG
jgi:hypothetical protein